MKNILLAVNIEEEAAMLFKKATELAAKFNAKLWVIHIAEPNTDFLGVDIGPRYLREFETAELKSEHQKLQKHIDKIIAHGVEAEGMLIQGHAVNEIIKESEILNADLIIMGHHEHSKLYNIFIGGLYSGIINKTKTPVMIVPVH